MNNVELWDLFQYRYSIASSNYLTDEECICLNKFGERGLIFSAPHSVQHLRENKTKIIEIGTGGLAEVLALLNKSISICSISCIKSDPNWDVQEGVYKKTIKNILQENNKNIFLVDIHGIKNEYGYDINIGTGIKPDKKNRMIVEKAIKLGNTNGINVSIDNPFNAKRRTTITSFSQELGADAIQLEIAQKFRKPLEDNNAASKILSFINELIKEL